MRKAFLYREGTIHLELLWKSILKNWSTEKLDTQLLQNPASQI